MIGHSEGGYVALTAADQAAEYAPELNLRGSVVLALGCCSPPAAVATLTGQTADEKASPRSGYITTLSQSWLRNYPELTTPEQWYTDVGMDAVPQAAELCQGAMVDLLSDTFGTYFRTDLPVERGEDRGAQSSAAQQERGPAAHPAGPAGHRRGAARNPRIGCRGLPSG